MKKGSLILILSMMLGGCALPVSFQIASWAADGISYIATNKSVSDHGLSLVTQKDCALWRAVKQEEICVQHEDSPTAIAARLDDEDDNYANQRLIQVAEIQEPDTAQNSIKFVATAKLAEFETAAGGPTDLQVSKAKIELSGMLKSQNISKNDFVTSKAAETKRYTGHSAGIFGAAGDHIRFTDIGSSEPVRITDQAQYSAGSGFVSLQGYSAGSLASAWDTQIGQSKTKIQWVFAASPAPQQDHDLNGETIELANAQVSDDGVSDNVKNVKNNSATIKIAETSERESALESSTIELINNDFSSSAQFRSGHYSDSLIHKKLNTAAPNLETEEALVISQPIESDKLRPKNTENVYFVIASFDDTKNATKLLARHRALDIQLVVGNFDGRHVYRGIVGPFLHKDISQAEKRIWRAGVKNAWAIHLDHSKWSFLYTASISEELSARY